MSTPSPTALVTGAGNGIGRALALRLGRAGRPVALVDRDAAALAAVAAEMSGPCCQVVADVCAADAAARTRETVEAQLGPVGILVNNAGIAPKLNGKGAGLLQTTDAMWDEVMAVNLRAMFRFTREFVPPMQARGWGRIVNVSSLGGRTRSLIAGPGYMASKAAVLGLTRSIASEFAADGITANSVAPGRIGGRLEEATDARINQQYLAAIPVGRFGQADEVAALIEYLTGEHSGFITGAVFDINGGFFMA
ncbi:SDR family oxidoreductase [Xylophilus rhododendri]|uniref:SDR family oxidoreductase n=1 Tax=Xylophilus rhododendri TaxID=2697032 RepID=A0A857JDJ7_9BURK|nr:SDR family oxidoreductase [Xylophilus rhododendri]QHJ01284.1 SDR family oxidoreductase [Xylophilus rhododendri]